MPSRIEILVEQTLTEVQRVAEGHATLERMISQMRQELTEQIGRLESQTSLGFREALQRLDRVEQRLGRVEQELGQVKQAVSETADRLGTHERAHTR